MLYLLVATTILIGFADRAARRGRIDLLLTDTRFRLFEIRDGLRIAAIEGAIHHDQWFDYFDTSLTKLIDLLPRLSIWQLIVLIFHYRNDLSLQRQQRELLDFLSLPENVEFARLFKQYMRVIGNFLTRRHRIFGFVTSGAAKFLASAGTLKGVKTDAANIIATAPETSTFQTHCPSH